MLTQVYLEEGVLELKNIDQFLMLGTRIDLGLIQDVTYLISKMAKLAAIKISDIYEGRRQSKDTAMSNPHTETDQSKLRAADIVGTSRTSTPLLIVSP